MPLTGALPPITEEDKPSIEQMIRKLVRFRKREHAHDRPYTMELDDAIEALQKYGNIKIWWDYPKEDYE